MNNKQALVVDDSRSARKVLERMLQKADLKVTTVEDAESALAYLRDHQPNIIFMDHMMPGMDGLEATRAIKEQPQLAHIPTIMYTSKDDADYMAQAKACGASDVLPKPAKQDILSKIIELYIEHSETIITQEDMPAVDTAPSEVDSKSESDINSDVDLSARLEQALTKQLSEGIQGLREELSASLNAWQNEYKTELTKIERDQAVSLKQQLSALKPPTKEQTFKSIQPILQKFIIQISQKVVKQKLVRLEESITQSESAKSDTESRYAQQNRQLQSQISQLKLIAYSSGFLAVAALVLTTILFLG